MNWTNLKWGNRDLVQNLISSSHEYFRCFHELHSVLSEEQMWLFETVMGTYILGECLKIYFDFYSFFYVLRLCTQVSFCFTESEGFTFC